MYTGQAGLNTLQQLLEQMTAVFKERSPQPKLHRLQVAHSTAREILSNQPQECFGFPEPLGLYVLGLEFFLLSWASWVIWSVILMHSSAKAWNCLKFWTCRWTL